MQAAGRRKYCIFSRISFCRISQAIVFSKCNTKGKPNLQEGVAFEGAIKRLFCLAIRSPNSWQCRSPHSAPMELDMLWMKLPRNNTFKSWSPEERHLTLRKHCYSCPHREPFITGCCSALKQLAAGCRALQPGWDNFFWNKLQWLR